VEAYSSFEPRDVEKVAGGRMAVLKTVSGGSPWLVIAPWFSERSRQLLSAAGVNYLDLVGNIRIELSQPGLFIDRITTTRPPKGAQSRVNLRGPKAGRIVRLLADISPPYGVFELATAVRVSPGYVSRVLEALERQAVIERGPRGTVVDVDWPELLRLRATSYEVFRTNRATFYIAPSGPAVARERLCDRPSPDVTLTGSFAVEEIVRVAAPSLLALYVERDATTLVADLELLPADQGANVVLLHPHDSSVVSRRRTNEAMPGSEEAWAPRLGSIGVVAYAQLVLDCLTGTGRMPAEGQALLDWMGLNEQRWRFPSLTATPGWI
jgi:hypothetical protein